MSEPTAYASRTPKSGPRPVTTMRINENLLSALSEEASRRGWSRNYLAEQILLKFVRERGHKGIEVRPVLR